MNWKKFVPRKIPLKNLRLPLPRRKKREKDTFPWKRVKTVCILLLLVCNVVLLAVAGLIKGYSWHLENQTRKQIDAMLAERGILCGSSVYRTLANCPQTYTLRPDTAAERAFAEAMLTGTVSASADRGNAVIWIGDNGTVRWDSSGNVHAYVTLNSIPQPQSPEQAQTIMKKILRDAGIEARDSQITVSQEAEGGFTIEVKQELNKTELIGCSLTAVIASGNEMEVIGTWCTGEIQPVTIRALSSYSSPQMIFTFVSQQGNFSQIVSAQPVYLLSDRSGGRFTTIPCWRFSTDSGEYILNILSGDVTLSGESDGEMERGSAPSV